MKLIFIYGPPAAGKLTVGQELARQTGFRLFHNHLTIELVKEIFPEPCEASAALTSRLRLEILEEAARSDVSVIFTFVYAPQSDDEFVSRVVEAVERHGGEVIFVQLKPSREVLAARAGQDSRQGFSKIKDPDFLVQLVEERDLLTSMAGRDSLVIDNSDISPEEVVRWIIDEGKISLSSSAILKP